MTYEVPDNTYDFIEGTDDDGYTNLDADDKYLDRNAAFKAGKSVGWQEGFERGYTQGYEDGERIWFDIDNDGDFKGQRNGS